MFEKKTSHKPPKNAQKISPEPPLIHSQERKASVREKEL